MRFEFIKIEQTEEGQIAYMLDHDRGVVIVAPVEWLGETSKPARSIRVPRVEYVEEERPEVIRRPVRREVIVEEEIVEDAPPARRPAPKSEKLYDGLKDVGHSKPSKANTIIPAHLRGLMRKDADIERRETIG